MSLSPQDGREADNNSTSVLSSLDGSPLSSENEKSSIDEKGDGVDYLPIGLRLIGIVVSLMLGVFCMALDNTIISVAIPKITDEFHNLNDVGWYASAYLLTGCSFQLLFGKLYTYFSIKWVFLIALFIFELGSLVCGVAPTSTALIIGRAIAGLGSAGLFTGALVTIAHTVSLDKRPMFFGLIGGVYGVASVAGPLMGGAFTDHLTWRWCFYINLPLGAVTAVGLVFLLKLKEKKKESLRNLFWRLDPIGSVVFVPAIVCLLLALQWGGVNYPWSNGRIIALFIIFGLTLIGFCILQVYLKENATVPARIARQRSIASASLFGLCIGGSFFIYIYFIPIWFQAIRNTSAVTAGVYSLPLILAEIVAIVVSGALVTHLGYFAPFFIGSSVLMSVGAGLLTLFTVDTPQKEWVGYQFLYGFGVGLGFQQGGVAAQAVLNLNDVSIGTAMVLFLQILGGSVFVSVAQNLFTNRLVEGIVKLNLPGLNPEAIVHAGATGLRRVVDPDYLPQVLVVYNDAILRTFQVGLILSCLSILGAVGIEWRSVKGKKTAGPGAA
ncbi:drug:H+ antiporter-2 [Coccidioides immitis RS]|uniref:MFS-type efflux pump MFS1 n=6 Tax=Coccidioides TaxID=5500 RepID=J3K5S2_COCIM|nr:drug:H+ antiporter-2 [Coccidioides immitis RS]XP_003070493.1 Major Facilitator Superfamily protein [Coccidioides posadasii C735 delta SOWgp]EFW18014.1 hypothetical protein CPSG_05651 [Coccidioides posadasii str. Silveira]KMM68718.1 SGE1 protein [Coccidioides posadasii RMSCC 3488]KMP06838.1 SGE1 protein [Coccidioides immitis RMSCC 2394]KMU91627.1 SGE1 [Coccidioides immitis H538.4]EAS29817.3 drug:H+ antiporter-2 [Coccidioides immitis RS]|eukprot:XP_003070493.1 Major Facilitator Superfamily protein [Coccidioides posadasii C735 delta SOWgp]